MKLIKMKCEDAAILANGNFNDYKYTISSDTSGGYIYYIYNMNGDIVYRKSGFNSVNNAVKEAASDPLNLFLLIKYIKIEAIRIERYDTIDNASNANK